MARDSVCRWGKAPQVPHRGGRPPASSALKDRSSTVSWVKEPVTPQLLGRLPVRLLWDMFLHHALS